MNDTLPTVDKLKLKVVINPARDPKTFEAVYKRNKPNRSMPRLYSKIQQAFAKSGFVAFSLEEMVLRNRTWTQIDPSKSISAFVCQTQSRKFSWARLEEAPPNKDEKISRDSRLHDGSFIDHSQSVETRV